MRAPSLYSLDGFVARVFAFVAVFGLRPGGSFACTQSGNTLHNDRDHFEFKRVRWVARDRLLTETCNGQVHLSPLRSSHKLLLEAIRRRGD